MLRFKLCKLHEFSEMCEMHIDPEVTNNDTLAVKNEKCVAADR